MENLKLWETVVKTDPAATKQFTKGGGFSGTAIKPYWLIKRATETFGVCGIGWGWTELENQFIAGIWCSKVQLWYIHNNQRGTIEQWGQTVMEGTNKNGRFVDEEAPKKAVTDAVTKCLSYLGFAGDVHMGMFDDSKYVSGLKKEFAEQAVAETSEQSSKGATPSKDEGAPTQVATEFGQLVAEANGMHLNDKERKFVNDQHERLRSQGAKATASPAQLKWLREIVARKTAKPAASGPTAASEPPAHIIEDGIPY
ncbi:MAG TPA: hypothetical protein VFE62_03080 [Gemmataceae bacterium]|nr:hypothetical protein [Gemmataceae bacterium]